MGYPSLHLDKGTLVLKCDECWCGDPSCKPPETPQQKVDRLQSEVKECERCRDGSAARLAAAEKELAAELAARRTRGQVVAAKFVRDGCEPKRVTLDSADGTPQTSLLGDFATSIGFARKAIASHIDAEIAREREACAKLLEEQSNRLPPNANLSICWNDVKRYYRYRADEIRARA